MLFFLNFYLKNQKNQRKKISQVLKNIKQHSFNTDNKSEY